VLSSSGDVCAWYNAKLYAGFSPSEAVSILTVDRSSDIEKIRRILEMKMVRERLKNFGFTPNEIEKKFSQLDDQQIHQLALSLDELKVVAMDGHGRWSF